MEQTLVVLETLCLIILLNYYITAYVGKPVMDSFIENINRKLYICLFTY